MTDTPLIDNFDIATGEVVSNKAVDDFGFVAMRDAVAKSQEGTRRNLAIALPVTYVVLVTILFVCVTGKQTSVDDASKIFNILISPISISVGTILGFYFAKDAKV